MKIGIVETINEQLEQGTGLFKENLRFIIHVPKKDQTEIPIREVERILLFGNINLSTPAIATCLESQINVLFLSPSGRYKGHLSNIEASNVTSSRDKSRASYTHE